MWGEASKPELAETPEEIEGSGEIESGQQYILIDDAIGQGETISELRFYIESNGEGVVGIFALTSGIYGAEIAIKPETVKKLTDRFGRKPLEDFLYEFNTAGSIEALTEKEGRFILKQPSLDSLRNRIFEAARRRNISPPAWEVYVSFQRG